MKGKPTATTSLSKAGSISKKASQVEAEVKEDEHEAEEEGDDEVNMDDILKRMSKAAAQSDDESEDDLAVEDAAADEAGWESGSISDNDKSDDEEEEPNAIDGSESEGSSVAIPTKKSKQPSKSAPKPDKTKATLPGKALTSSTFLPSLSTGFTLGDSDSDPDLDPDVDGGGIVGRKTVERKNRRGQRARQA